MCLFVGSLAQVWRLQHVLTNVSVSPRGFCHCWLFTSPLIIVTLTTCGHQVTRNVWDGHYTLRRFKQQFSYSSIYCFSQNVYILLSQKLYSVDYLLVGTCNVCSPAHSKLDWVKMLQVHEVQPESPALIGSRPGSRDQLSQWWRSMPQQWACRCVHC